MKGSRRPCGRLQCRRSTWGKGGGLAVKAVEHTRRRQCLRIHKGKAMSSLPHREAPLAVRDLPHAVVAALRLVQPAGRLEASSTRTARKGSVLVTKAVERSRKGSERSRKGSEGSKRSRTGSERPMSKAVSHLVGQQHDRSEVGRHHLRRVLSMELHSRPPSAYSCTRDSPYGLQP